MFLYHNKIKHIDIEILLISVTCCFTKVNIETEKSTIWRITNGSEFGGEYISMLCTRKVFICFLRKCFAILFLCLLLAFIKSAFYF